MKVVFLRLYFDDCGVMIAPLRETNARALALLVLNPAFPHCIKEFLSALALLFPLAA